MILLISPKGVYATKRFIEEAKNTKVKLDIFDAKDLARQNFEIDVSKYQTLFFRQSYPYEKEIFKLAQKFIKAGKKVIDEPSNLEDVIAGKWRNHQILEKAGLPVPKSFLLEPEKVFKSYILHHPYYIIKWIYGLKGREVFLIKDESQLEAITKKFLKSELMVQEFIRADYEYKVITIGYKSVPVALKFKIQSSGFRIDFKKFSVIPTGAEESLIQPSNLEQGIPSPLSVGRNDKMIGKVVKVAEKASKILKRKLAKVDILDKGGMLYILEVNRWPGLKSFESLSKYNLTGDFINYLSGFTKEVK